MELHKLMIVGNAEWCNLPQLNIPAVRARIDSGAKTSSIHAVNIREFYKRRQQWVRFEIHPLRVHTDLIIECEAPVYDFRQVKNSSGDIHPRYVIQTDIIMGGERWTIQVTLANRRSMGFQMLLGREAMTNRILINPSEDFQLTRYTRRQIREFYGIASAKSGTAKKVKSSKKKKKEVEDKKVAEKKTPVEKKKKAEKKKAIAKATPVSKKKKVIKPLKKKKKKISSKKTQAVIMPQLSFDFL